MKIDNKNFLLILAAATIIFLSITAFYLGNSDTTFKQEIIKLQNQSTSSEIDTIEEDLLDTDLTGLDKELSDIEKEIEAVY